MPKQGRAADTLQFIRGATLTPTSAENYRQQVSEWIEELTISPVIDKGMSQGTAGTELTRKYRRAMILILCTLNHLPVARAQQIVAQYSDQNLQAALGTMINDVQRVYAPARLNPALQQLLASPDQFLTHNRIKTGKGSMTTSAPSQFEMTWDSPGQFYFIEPPVAFHHNLHISFPGYNIAVTKFTDVSNNLGAIAGAVVQGNIGITTQLSGCSIFYSVNGAQLVMAHVWPNDVASVKANLPPALQAQAGLPAGAVLALRLAYQGGLSNALGGGTLGIFGMVANPNDTQLRAVGPNNVRTHGYVDTAGNAYFMAVMVGGSWQLFGQQNNPGQPAGGVSSFVQIYP